MKPTLEEIKNALPAQDPEQQLVYIEEDEITTPGFVESFVLRIRSFTVKLFRLPRIKKVIFVAVMSLAALDGIQVCIPDPSQREFVIQGLQNPQQWTLNIESHPAPDHQSRYYLLGAFSSPTPVDVPFVGPDSTLFAPITGSAVIPQNLSYRIYDPNRDLS